MFDIKFKNKVKLFGVLFLLIMISFSLNFTANARLVKDAEGNDRVRIYFNSDRNFEIKNMLGAMGEDYKITFKKDGVSKSANFSASGGSDVNINVNLTKKTKVLTGTLKHGEKIPVPDGYTFNECDVLLSVQNTNAFDDVWKIAANSEVSPKINPNDRKLQYRVYLGGGDAAFPLVSYIIIGTP